MKLDNIILDDMKIFANISRFLRNMKEVVQRNVVPREVISGEVRGFQERSYGEQQHQL